MRLGCCATVEQLELVQEAGFDFCEMRVGTVLPDETEKTFEAVSKAIGKLRIVPEAWNNLLPWDMRLTGPEVDMERIGRYLRTALKRIAHLGGQVVVFGSGGSRNTPKGFPIIKANEQVKAFLGFIGKEAEACGLTIAIEPLNRESSNIINTIAEAVNVANEVNHPNIKVLADLYHMQEVGESPYEVMTAGKLLAHAHIADTNRLYPGSGNYPHLEYFQALKAMNYQGRMSIECAFTDFPAESPKALEFLRKLDAEVNG